ncbi:MAG: TrfB-related DNA-binding protein [Betaproteobacteria bacterium]|nr:TrfB-related DNA-binding protein [Betaproteobacteria bacterium]
MSASEFEAVRPLLNISQERVEAARLALVDDRTFQTVGERYGWSRQAVWDAVGVVWKQFGRYKRALAAMEGGVALPPGWESATIAAPTAMIARFRLEAAEAAAAAGWVASNGGRAGERGAEASMRRNAGD